MEKNCHALRVYFSLGQNIYGNYQLPAVMFDYFYSLTHFSNVTKLFKTVNIYIKLA